MLLQQADMLKYLKKQKSRGVCVCVYLYKKHVIWLFWRYGTIGAWVTWETVNLSTYVFHGLEYKIPFYVNHRMNNLVLNKRGHLTHLLESKIVFQRLWSTFTFGTHFTRPSPAARRLRAAISETRGAARRGTTKIAAINRRERVVGWLIHT